MRPYREKVPLPADASFRFLVREDPAFDFAWHHHPECELTLIVQSHGQRFVGDSIAPYRDGDLVLIGPDLPHTWRSEPDAQQPRQHDAQHLAYCAQFAPSVVTEPGPELRRIAQLLERANQGLHITGPSRDAAAAHLAAMPEADNLARLLHLLQALQHIADAPANDVHPLATPGFAAGSTRRDSRRIDRVCRFINDHAFEDLSQGQAADVAEMSPAAFCRFFKRSTGRTFVDYLTELRVGRACEMLIATDRPITDIAFACGYNNLSNFNRRFRRLKGCTPRDFRHAHATHA